MTKIEAYVKEIPEEIRQAIRGLDSDYRAAIFVALYKHGDLSFSGLQKKLEIGKAMLNYHLGKLIESALVQHYYKHELGTEKYSFYGMTSFGQDFVEILSRFLTPQPYPIALAESPTIAPERLVDFRNIFATCYLQSVADLHMDSWKEIASIICSGTRTRDLANAIWYVTDNTNLGSSVDVIIPMEQRSATKNRPTPHATI